MSTVTFDTLKYVETLEGGLVSQKIKPERNQKL